MGMYVSEPRPGSPYGRQDPPRSRVNWWLRLTSSGWDKPQITIQQREVARRSRLTSWIILGLTVVLLLLAFAGIADPATLLSVGIVMLGTAVAAILNRAGQVTIAGSLLVFLFSLGIVGAVTGAPQGKLTLVYLPAYDLFAIPVIIAASILPRVAAFIVAGVEIAAIVGDFFLQSKGDDIVYWLKIEGPVPLLVRPIALMLIIATVAYLWVRGTDEQMRRADRAEEVAEYERRELESKQAVEVGVEDMRTVLTRLANGDFNARTNIASGNPLWPLGQSLNNMVQRLQRQGQSEYQLRRTEEEAQRLATALDEVNAGRYPLWPARANTVIDLLLDRVAARSQPAPRGGHPSQQQQAIPSQQRPQAPLPLPGFTPAGPGGQSSFPPAPYPAQPQMPSTGGLQEGWPSLSPGQQPYPQSNKPDDRPMQSSDNPWFLPPEGGNW